MKRAPLASINITPLVDVLLILVALLLLMAPQMVKVLPADLPELAIDGKPRQQQSVLVTIDAEGNLSVEGQPLSVEDVIARIKPHRTTIEIASSGKVAYQVVIDVVAKLRKAEPREIQMVVR
jgi:biopolymer transport protein ExbD